MPAPESVQGSAARPAHKAYYVYRPARTVTTVLVYAHSAADAVERASGGEGQAIDSETTNVGRGQARRAPEEDA